LFPSPDSQYDYLKADQTVLTRWVPNRTLLIMRTMFASSYYAIRKFIAEAGH
jgi:hypothetical protein